MQKKLQLKSVTTLLAAFIVATGSTFSSAEEGSRGFAYTGCWNSKYAPPLLECSGLSISESLEAVSFPGTLEAGLATKSDRNFFVLRSREIPIVVPKKNYENQNDWVYEGRKYIKVKKNMPTLVEGETTDVVAIVDNLDKIKDWKNKTSIQDLEFSENTRRTFWYSPSRGVEAISVGPNPWEMQAYFCTKKPCLFATAVRRCRPGEVRCNASE